MQKTVAFIDYVTWLIRKAHKRNKKQKKDEEKIGQTHIHTTVTNSQTNRNKKTTTTKRSQHNFQMIPIQRISFENTLYDSAFARMMLTCFYYLFAISIIKTP